MKLFLAADITEATSSMLLQCTYILSCYFHKDKHESTVVVFTQIYVVQEKKSVTQVLFSHQTTNAKRFTENRKCINKS